MDIRQLERKVNKNKNRNTRVVVIRSQHLCSMCNTLLRVGTKCLTTNNRKEGRRWTCSNCVKQRLNNKVQCLSDCNRKCNIYRSIVETIMELKSAPFGDEGGAMALMETLSEYEEQCLDCGKCSFSDYIITDKI